MADSPAGAARAFTIADLKRVSAELARDALLIQGAGGNTSLKCDDVLWVKASGCWLEDAEEKAQSIGTCATSPSIPPRSMR